MSQSLCSNLGQAVIVVLGATIVLINSENIGLIRAGVILKVATKHIDIRLIDLDTATGGQDLEVAALDLRRNVDLDM